MEVHQVVLTIIDHDELGRDEILAELENARFPNDCISLDVRSIETRDIGEWSDDHPLNRNATAAAELKRLFDKPKDSRGVPIGVCDRNGNPLHIGDGLEFDAQEWGEGGCVFIIRLDKGQIVHPGATSDLSNWCDLVRGWDGSEPMRPTGR